MTDWEMLQPVIRAATAAMPVREGDYTVDGVLYCGRCQTPKRAEINIGGVDMMVPVMCSCAEKEWDKLKKAEEHRQSDAYINQLRIQNINDIPGPEMTFDKDDGSAPDITTKAKRYVERWDTLLKVNAGLLLWGNTGNGKTFTAACIANALIDKGVPVLMTSFPKILSAVTGMYAEDRVEYLNEMKNFKLLILDDFGAERNTSFALETVYAVIDARYQQRLPLIVTTNLSLDELKSPKDMSYQRIYDRVREMCVPIKFEAASRRKEKAKDKFRVAQEIFA